MSWFVLSNLAEIVIVYVVIAALVFTVICRLFSDEPTAHGQAVASFFAFWIGALWPVALPCVLVFAILALIKWAWDRVSSGVGRDD